MGNLFGGNATTRQPQVVASVANNEQRITHDEQRRVDPEPGQWIRIGDGSDESYNEANKHERR